MASADNARREVRGYAAVRSAAKDFKTYSSDLLGDRDVRSYRQLPLESDPTRHTDYRAALMPLFMSTAIEPKADQFRQLALRLINGISARGHGEIGEDLALPYVMGCLTIIYNRPQDFDEWVSWGPDVWTAEVHAKGQEVTAHTKRAQRERDYTVPTQRSSTMLDTYLGRVFDAADRRANKDPETMDVWDFVTQLTIDGQPLSRQEMYGIGSLLLAGGRDTVIKLITGLTWHLLNSPDDRTFLAANPQAFDTTIAEMARYFSPLPKVERILAQDRPACDQDADPSTFVVLSTVSANFDRRIWPDAERLDIHRERRPHLAFGAGRHSCMGMNITEYEAKAFLDALVTHWPGWTLDGPPDIDYSIEGEPPDTFNVIDRFNAVRVVTTGLLRTP